MGREARYKKMKQQIIFGNTTKDKRRFKLIYTGFRAWAQDQKHQQSRDKKDRKAEAEIMTALESISNPIGDLAEEDEFDFRDRKLNDDGGEIIISGTAYALLKARLDEAPMRLEIVVEQEDMLDWLKGSAKELPEEEQKIHAVK